MKKSRTSDLMHKEVEQPRKAKLVELNLVTSLLTTSFPDLGKEVVKSEEFSYF